jgi:flavorubredoxin
MIESTEIADRIYRISIWDEPILAGMSFPETSYNMFLIAGERPAIINTLFRRSFPIVRAKIAQMMDPAELRYIVVPHHEGDSAERSRTPARSAQQD